MVFFYEQYVIWIFYNWLRACRSWTTIYTMINGSCLCFSREKITGILKRKFRSNLYRHDIGKLASWEQTNVSEKLCFQKQNFSMMRLLGYNNNIDDTSTNYCNKSPRNHFIFYLLCCINYQIEKWRWKYNFLAC